MLGLFLMPDARERLVASELDEVVLKHALEVVDNGYTVIPKAISEEKCLETIDAFRDWEARNEDKVAPFRDEFGHYPRFVNLHTAIPELQDLYSQNAIYLAVLDVLFGREAVLYTTLFYETGSEQSIHRDTPYFSTRPQYLYFGSTVYLEEANDENGCLEVLAGAHKLPELDLEAMAASLYGADGHIPKNDELGWMTYQSAVMDQARAAGIESVRVHVGAGDALIWHPQLPHGGTPILNQARTRFSLVMHTTPVGMPVYHQDVFFSPKVDFSGHAPWGYFESGGRKFADFSDPVVGIGTAQFPIGSLASSQTEIQPA